MIQFFVPGTPKAQPRPRATMRGGRAGVYDPGSAGEWKLAIRQALSLALLDSEEGREMMRAAKEHRDPLRLAVSFSMPRPQKHLRKGGLRDDAPRHWHTQKPDGDNLLKAVLDAINDSGHWADDSQAVVTIAQKTWTPPGKESGAMINIRKMGEPE